MARLSPISESEQVSIAMGATTAARRPLLWPMAASITPIASSMSARPSSSFQSYFSSCPLSVRQEADW